MKYHNLCKYCVLLFVLAWHQISIAQGKPEAITDSWVIKLSDSVDQKFLKSGYLTQTKKIFPELQLWEITFRSDLSNSRQLALLREDINILQYHQNVRAEWRQVPDDPDFPSQWGLTQIEMEKAWDISTGGKAPNGDDIVVAIFDDGFEIGHPDLINNIWTNPYEIEDNGIDDDMNGYVDDYYGWNATEENDEHRILNHGTAVAGIIGAVGNNNNQVAGINWDVKLMLTSGGRGSSVALSDVVLGYNYVYVQRKTYNETQGARGAYVVVTNYSGGAPDLFPDDFPSVCEIYDLLGQEGVLSVTSAPNTDTDVDVEGDLPSTCPSQYLIVVTNTDRDDLKETNAGYGTMSIDIGAPGDDIFTTGVNSNIDPDFAGASASAPHVAGVISLLYSIICEEPFELSINDPSQVAVAMRDAIFDKANFNESLVGITTTGGRLNAFNSLTEILETLGNCCEVTINRLSIESESCQDANDGIIEIEASGDRLRGTLFYSLDGISGSTSDSVGYFNRLDPSFYTLTIFDDDNDQCFLDTMLVVPEELDICPFGEFEIIGLLPNPAFETLEIQYELDELKLIQIQIHDAMGRLVFNQLIMPDLLGNKSYLINIRDYPQGIYFASILATGIRDTQRFIVSH